MSAKCDVTEKAPIGLWTIIGVKIRLCIECYDIVIILIPGGFTGGSTGMCTQGIVSFVF